MGQNHLFSRKAAQADDTGAMLLDDGIHGGHRFGGALIEKAFRGRDEIGQRQADQPVARAGGHEGPERRLNSPPHRWIIIEGFGEMALTRRDGELNVFELDGEGTRLQALHAQVVGQLAQKPAKGSVEKGQIRGVLIERRLMAQTLRLPTGHHRVPIDALCQFLERDQARAPHPVEHRLKHWIEEVGNGVDTA